MHNTCCSRGRRRGVAVAVGDDGRPHVAWPSLQHDRNGVGVAAVVVGCRHGGSLFLLSSLLASLKKVEGMN